MNTQEILDLIALRAENARQAAKRDDLAGNTYTHANHWELIAYILEDVALAINYSTKN